MSPANLGFSAAKIRVLPIRHLDFTGKIHVCCRRAKDSANSCGDRFWDRDSKVINDAVSRVPIILLN
jgi:hypothetical protein